MSQCIFLASPIRSLVWYGPRTCPPLSAPHYWLRFIPGFRAAFVQRLLRQVFSERSVEVGDEGERRDWKLREQAEREKCTMIRGWSGGMMTIETIVSYSRRFGWAVSAPLTRAHRARQSATTKEASDGGHQRPDAASHKL